MLQLLDILRAIHGTPAASEQSFTASMIQGAERVRELFDTKTSHLRSEYDESQGVIRSLQEKLAACEQEASASDAHASAMEEQTMRAMDVEEVATKLWNESHTYEETVALLRKHFRAAPAVYLTDFEALVADFFDGESKSKYMERRDWVLLFRKFTRPASREALAKVIADAADGSLSVSRDVADAVLSFLGAVAQSSIVVGESRSGDASKMPQHEGASPDSSSPPAPAPQESDVESLARAMLLNDKAMGVTNWEETQEWVRIKWIDAARAALSWFRAHRVVELPKVKTRFVSDAYANGYNDAIQYVRRSCDRAGIAHRSST